MKSTTVDSSIAKTHAALFNTWFPSEELPTPSAIKLDIIRLAAEVSDEMLKAFNQSAFLVVLQGMTVPKLLPFYDDLVQSKNPAVQAFVTTPGGYGDLPVEQRLPLFSFFFAGDYNAATAQMAMQIREAYLTGIWDLPLAVPLAEIQTHQFLCRTLTSTLRATRRRFPQADSTITLYRKQFSNRMARSITS